MSTLSESKKPDLDFNTPSMLRTRKFRAFKNRLTTHSIAAGGMSIIVAILLIFFYLLWEIMPLFKEASIEHWPDNTAQVGYAVPGKGSTLYLAIEEQAQIGLRITDTQQAIFFKASNGEIISEQQLKAPANTKASSFAIVSES